MQHTSVHQTAETLEGISQNDKSFARIPDRGVMPKASWMYHAYKELPLKIEINGEWRYIPRTFLLPKPTNREETERIEPVCIDQGNGFLKFGFQSLEHRLQSISFPTRIEVVSKNSRHGQSGRPTWRIGNEEKLATTRYRAGNDTSPDDSRGFAVGTTAERFEDDEYLTLIKIGLVQALRAAGHQPGRHVLAASVLIRVPEVTVDERSGKQIIVAGARNALKKIKGSFTVEYRLGDLTEIWHLNISRVFATIQPAGTYFLWSRNLVCDHAQESYVTIDVLDWGTGDLGNCKARQRPGQPLTIDGDIISDGAIKISENIKSTAKAIIPNLKLSLADAQQAVVTNEIEVGGRAWPLIRPEDLQQDDQDDNQENHHPREDESVLKSANMDIKIDRLRTAYKEAVTGLITEANPILKDSSVFLINTGGSLKNEYVLDKLTKRIRTHKRDASDHLNVPNELAIEANALGGFVYCYWQLKLLSDALDNA